jgi:hypothetical protein
LALIVLEVGLGRRSDDQRQPVSPVGVDIAPHPWPPNPGGGERLGRYHHGEPTIAVGQRLAYGIALIVVPAPREREELRLEIGKPWGALGKKNQTRLELCGDDGHASGLVAIGFDRENPIDLAEQLLDNRNPGAGVLDKHPVCSMSEGKSAHSGLEFGIVDPFPPDVDEIPSPVAGYEPGRADREVVLGSALARGVPALEDERALARGQFHIPLDPMALDHGAAGRDRHLLILGRERVAAEFTLHLLENRKRLANR